MKWIEANLWRAVALLLGALVMALAGWVALLLVQIHGAPIIGGGLKPALARCEADWAALMMAQAEAEALQAAVNEDEERRTAANAERSDAYHAQDKTRAADAGRDYARNNRIAADRMRATGDRSATGQAAAAAESGGAGIHEALPAGSFVAVSDPDLQACTAAVTWAVGAYNWAQTFPGRTNAPQPAEPAPAR